MGTTTDGSKLINTSVTGYVVNALLSKSSQRAIREIQAAFISEFQDTIWATPEEALHITLLDLLSPLVEYGRGKDALFDTIFPKYHEVLNDTLRDRLPIDLIFEKIVVTPSAIIIVGDGQGTETIDNIREQLLRRVNLLPDTKQPPTIAHSTLMRFVGETSLEEVKRFAGSLDISFTERIDTFQLVRESRLPMLEYTQIETYSFK